MTESPIDEVTRILTTCPEGDRLAGVLRVVRALAEQLDTARREAHATQERLNAARSWLSIALSKLCDPVVMLREVVEAIAIGQHRADYGESGDDMTKVERERGAVRRALAEIPPRWRRVVPNPEVDAIHPRLALADAAMPIIRSQGFVQFGPNCVIHADKIASPASPIIRNAFLAWMESVEQYHAARSAAHPEPDREERADAEPSPPETKPTAMTGREGA